MVDKSKLEVILTKLKKMYKNVYANNLTEIGQHISEKSSAQKF